MAGQPLSRKAYSNWKMLDMDGQPMCMCGEDRADWYIKRGLAKLVSKHPPVFQLTFIPHGPGHRDHGAEYFLSEKESICVVCGSTEVTRHHVVPYQYRRYLPLEYKSRRSHDILLLCLEHHEEYERHSLELQRVIAKRYGIEAGPLKNEGREIAIKVGMISRTLLSRKLKDKIPAERRAELTRWVALHLGHDPDDGDLMDLYLTALSLKHRRTLPEETHGYRVAQKLIEEGTIEDFVIEWRQHFIDKMKPAYLPIGWTVDLVVSPAQLRA